MKCPIDHSDLVMSDRHGVEIDYCPTCRGVWLDRGELDKIIDRAGAAQLAPVALAEPARAPAPVDVRDAPPRADRRRHRDDDDDDDDDDEDRRRAGHIAAKAF